MAGILFERSYISKVMISCALDSAVGVMILESKGGGAEMLLVLLARNLPVVTHSLAGAGTPLPAAFTTLRSCQVD